MTSIYSRVRWPWRSKGTPRAWNSSASHPTPTPRMNRPPLRSATGRAASRICRILAHRQEQRLSPGRRGGGSQRSKVGQPPTGSLQRPLVVISYWLDILAIVRVAQLCHRAPHSHPSTRFRNASILAVAELERSFGNSVKPCGPPDRSPARPHSPPLPIVHA